MTRSSYRRVSNVLILKSINNKSQHCKTGAACAGVVLVGEGRVKEGD
jgi:hypothetical protein